MSYLWFFSSFSQPAFDACFRGGREDRLERFIEVGTWEEVAYGNAESDLAKQMTVRHNYVSEYLTRQATADKEYVFRFRILKLK